MLPGVGLQVQTLDSGGRPRRRRFIDRASLQAVLISEAISLVGAGEAMPSTNFCSPHSLRGTQHTIFFHLVAVSGGAGAGGSMDTVVTPIFPVLTSRGVTTFVDV